MIKYLLLLLTTTLGALTLESNAFFNGGDIPTEYTCEGASATPELHWSDVPETTKAFALIVTDISIYKIHTRILSISGDTRQLSKGGYNMSSICPPRGERHSYEFALYALDNSISDKSQLQQHTLAVAKLTGSYQRPLSKKKVAFLGHSST